MAAWPKLLLLFLLCAIVAEAGKAAGKEAPKAKKEDLFDFSKEDDDKSEFDYSTEHHSKEFGHKASLEDEEYKDFEGITVCRGEGKPSRCKCSEHEKRVDCTRETLSKLTKNFDDLELMSANINVEGFKPKYVYLTGNDIMRLHRKSLMPKMQDTVEGIDLGMNKLNHIEPGAFDGFTKLRKLRLNHNKIPLSKEEDGWISKALGGTLEILNLAFNQIENLEDGTFDPLHKLKRLILDGNPKIGLTNKTFGTGLKELTILSLDFCELTADIPADAFKELTSLSYLSLIGNPITAIPAALKPVTSLRTLDLSETAFTEWKTDMMNDFSLLQTLYLRGVEGLSKFGNCAFCGLTGMKTIDIGGNKNLKSFDENAFGYAKNSKGKAGGLYKFIMDNCSVSALPPKLLDWAEMKHIEIGLNPWDCSTDEMHYFTADLHLTNLKGKHDATCALPKSMNGTSLQQMIKDAHTSSGFAGFIKTVFYMGIAMAIVGTLLTVILHVSKNYDGNIRNLFTRQRSTGAGFSNLNAEANMEEEFINEEDNEFEIRPAAV